MHSQRRRHRVQSRVHAWFAAFAAGLVVLAADRSGAGTTQRHTYRFDTSRVSVTDAGSRIAVQGDALPSTWEAGRPELPYDIVTFLVPMGSRLVSVRAQATQEVTLATGTRLRPAAAIVDDAGRPKSPPQPRAAPRGAGAASATTPLAEFAGTGALHGYQLLSLRVYPVRYDEATGTVTAARGIELELDLESGGAIPLQRQRYSPAIETRAQRMLAGLVANPEDIAPYDRRLGVRVEKSAIGGFQPTDAPSLEGSDVEYVIVTTDALAATWQTYADWKTRRGIPTVVRTVSWIEANYRRGADVQETIRTFVKDAYAKWAVQYVLLAGDTDTLPARYGFSTFGVEFDLPSDAYFACLDGNWNLDGDNLWGEPALGEMAPGDSTDLYAEVFVGRLTAKTPSEASALIAKLMAYENPTQTQYQSKMLLLGEVLFPVDWQQGNPINLDGAGFCEEMAGFTPACVTKTRLYENHTAFTNAAPLSRAASIAEMSAGHGFVNHIGHGYRYSMSLGDASLVNGLLADLTNVDQQFILYMLNCTASAFDFPCLGEAFLEATGGAVAVLGASRSAYAIPSRNYNRGFVEAVYQLGYAQIGPAFVQSRLAYTSNAWLDTGDHYTHLIYALLGDPEMVMHTCTLGTTAATYPASIGRGLVNVTVHVTVDGAAREGALVCLQKGTEEYEFGITNAAGDITLPFRGETNGTVQVTVSGQNMTTHLGTLTVSGTGPYVRVQSVTVDDNSSGNSNGNSDGVIDAGERIELTTVLHNSGSSSSGTLSGRLRILASPVTIHDSTYSASSISAGNTATSTNQVNFTIPATVADGSVYPLRFVSTGNAQWHDTVNKVVHAPNMQLTLLDVLDPAPDGNEDGIIQAGEIFELVAYFKNFGSGAADGLGATLTSADPDVTIFNGAVTIGRANAMQELTAPTRFRLRETALQENTLTLTLTDNRGRMRVWPLTLREPAVPASPVLDASPGNGIVLVAWLPSFDPDLAGYHVYRATAAGGPWTRTTVDRTARIAYFRDTGLAPSTRYYYRVTALDTAGNESAPSGTTTINTNPAQLAGWPINLGASSSCPVAVGDITGDGSKEIVAGNDHLYAWNWNGSELRDDDDNPQTWGLFADEVQTVTGAVALTQLDATPGYEIFALSWEDSNKAWVVRGDGSMMPGWPRRPDPTSTQKGYWSSASAADVDGDGRPELFASAKNGNLYAWRWDGTPLGATDAFKSNLGLTSRSSPSFASVDWDPQPEIIFAGPDGVLNVWNADGSNVGSFPKTPGGFCYSNTAVGDIDRNGIQDIVVVTHGGAINVYNSKTGNQLPGWPQPYSLRATPIQPSPALADFDFDGYLEIVVANNDFNVSQSGVRVYDHLGVLRPGWPQLVGGFSSESSPIVADLSGDGVPDILFGNEGGLLYGWDRDGNAIDGFPLSVGDFIRSTPTADDVDGDGDIDLVLAGWDRNVYIWDSPVPYVRAAAQWPTLKHDVERTGSYDYRPRMPTDADPAPVVARVPRVAFLDQNVPNPFNPVTSIAYGVPAQDGRATVDVGIDIFDAGGRLVRRLVRGPQAPGTYKALWDGRDDGGRRVHSGIYFYRLRAAGTTVARKMLLLQ